MKLPNKIFTTKESCIGKFPVILNVVKEKPITPILLYKKTKKDFPSVIDFIETLDALFYLGKIKFNEKEGVSYVDGN